MVHGSISAVLRTWVEKVRGDDVACSTWLTQQLIQYLRNCLDQVPIGGSWEKLRGPVFGLLEYAFHHWHVHYRKVMGRIVPPLSLGSTLLKVHDTALTFFTAAQHQFQPQPSYQEATSDVMSNGVSPQLSSPVLVAAGLGLLDIVVRLMDEPKHMKSPPAKHEDGSQSTEEDERVGNSHESQRSDPVDVFHIACQFGYYEMVEYFIHQINGKHILTDELALACLRGDERIFNTLLHHYEEVLGFKDLPPQLLCNACLAGHTSIADTLLAHGVDPNKSAGGLPLHKAVERGHLDVVDLLLQHGADAMATFPDKSTPLHHSIQHGYGDITLRLLQVPDVHNTPDEYGVTALHLAAEMGDVSIIQQILDLGPPIVSEMQEDGPSPTIEEASMSRLDSPLHRASANGHLEAVRLLLDRGHSVDSLDSRGRSALYLALYHDQRSVVDYLLRYLSDKKDKVNITLGSTYDKSELKQAISHRNISAVKELLCLGASPNGSDDSASSPLADAVRADNADIVNTLLEHSASMNQAVDFAKDQTILGESIGDGWLPHHLAAYNGSINVIEVLITALPAGFTHSRTGSGYTPLHLAVFCEQTEITRRLLLTQPQVVAGDSGSMNGAPPKAGIQRKDSWKPSVLGLNVPPSKLANTSSVFSNVNSQTDHGITALHIAAASGNVDLAESLVTSNALLEMADKSGKRAMHYAADAKKNAQKLVRLLLQYRAEVQPQDLDGMTPLHLAVCASDEDHTGAVLLLLQKGADPNAVTRDGLSPLYLAANSGSTSLVRSLLKYGADPNVKVNNEGYTALHAAVATGETEMVKILIEVGADVNVTDDTGDTPLHGAARSENIQMADILIEGGASLNATNTRRITALHRAVLNESTEMAELLLSNGAHPNIHDEDGDTTLTVATMAGDTAMVELLMDSEYGTKVDVINSRGQTPLMLAVRRGSSDSLLSSLLQIKPDVLLCGEDGKTALHLAAAQGSLPEVTPLLEYGKDYLNIKDREGLTPVHHAARLGRAVMVKKLRDVGADMTTRDRQGRTAMHFAVMTMWASTVEDIFGAFLCPDAGNKVNISDDDGWMPLHWACMVDDAELINLLIDRCDTDEAQKDLILQKRKHGWTPLAIVDLYGKNSNKKALLDALERLKAAGVEGIAADVPSTKAVEQPTRHGNVYCDDCHINVRYRRLSYH